MTAGAGLAKGLQQLTRFGMAGLAGTAVHFALLFVLVGVLGMEPGVSAACGAVVGAIVNYSLAHSIVFRSNRPHVSALPRFAAMATFGAIVNGTVVDGLSRLGLHYMLGQIAATVLVMFLNFGISSLWVFKSHRD